MDTQRNEEFISEIKKRLTPYRFYHSLNVAEEAKRLALKYGADPDKAFTAVDENGERKVFGNKFTLYAGTHRPDELSTKLSGSSCASTKITL